MEKEHIEMGRLFFSCSLKWFYEIVFSTMKFDRIQRKHTKNSQKENWFLSIDLLKKKQKKGRALTAQPKPKYEKC